MNTRRQFRAAMRRSSPKQPKPKFKLGDYVQNTDWEEVGFGKELFGKVVKVHDYDPHLGSRRYSVRPLTGTQKIWNENHLIPVSKEPEKWHVALDVREPMNPTPVPEDIYLHLTPRNKIGQAVERAMKKLHKNKEYSIELVEKM